MTTAERNAIPTPAVSLLVFDTSLNGSWYFDGTAWVPLFSTSNGWSLTGNANTVDGTHFMGTTDNIPLTLRVNNEPAGRVDHLLFSTFFGYLTGAANNTGTCNTAIGSAALLSNTTAYRNTATGYRTLYSNTTSSNNTAIGHLALQDNISGYSNVDLLQAFHPIRPRRRVPRLFPNFMAANHPTMNFTTHAHIGRDHYRMEIRTANLLVIADEPTDGGGTGQGFSAHQLLSAALGACTNATVRMYADRKEWPLEAIDTEVVITHGESFDITNIQRNIRFTGALDETQRTRLLEIANRCPIHRTLTGNITASTKLV